MQNSKERLSRDEQFEVIRKLIVRMENNFIETGEMLSQVRKLRTFKMKGYRSFGEFVEVEYGMPRRLANQLTKTYDLFIGDMDIDSETIKEIGFDKLQMIAPLIKDRDYEVQEQWVLSAKENTYPELKERVKEIRAKEREDAKTLQDILLEQYYEKMLGYFNCSKKELNYLLAIYFNYQDLDEVNDVIRANKKEFEQKGDNNGNRD